MIPERDGSQTAAPGQVPLLRQRSLAEHDFYATRRRFVRNLPRYARSARIGKASRLLELVAARSRPADPFCWVVTGTQAQWAEQCGVSRATLQRWVSELRSAGYLTGEVRISPALAGRRHQGVEYPVFGIPERVVEEVSRWADNDFWPAAREPHNEAYVQNGEPVDETVDNPQTAAIAGDLGDSVTQVTPSPNNSNRTSSRDTAGRTSRRLRQRGADTVRRRHEDDDYDPPVIGQEPDPEPRTDQRRGTPTAQADRTFQDSWRTMLREHPSVSMKVPAQPWLSGHKKWYMGWLKNQFLPAMDGDLERAGRVFDLFCRHLVEGSEFVPANTSPFQRLHTRTDKYARLVPVAASDSVEDFYATGGAMRAQVADARRRGAEQRRRRLASQKLPEVDVPYFLD